MIPSRRYLSAIAFLLLCGAASRQAPAQAIQAPLNRGFVRSSSIDITVEEMIGTRQRRGEKEIILGPGFPALQVAEVQYKSVRMLRMSIPDADGKRRSQNVWYMIWRAIARDYVDLAGQGEARENLNRRLSDETLDPQNPVEAAPAANLMIPRFVLRTLDEDGQHAYADIIDPRIARAVLKREFRGELADLPLLSSVQATTPFAEPVSITDEQPLKHAVYGVAIWLDVDPETDFLQVEMSGFTNAYRVLEAKNGELQAENKIIIQKFSRPGDRYDENEQEFRVDGRPEWVYQPRDELLKFTGDLSVLRRPGTAAVPADTQ